MKRWIILAVAVFVMGVAPVHDVHAAAQSLNMEVDVVFDEEKVATVTYDIRGTNAQDQEEVVIPVIGRSNDDVSAVVDGQTAGVSSRDVASDAPFAPDFTEAIVALPGSLQSAGDSWELSIEYQTGDLYADYKQMQTIAIPDVPITAGSVAEQWRVSLPLEDGLPIAFGLEPTDSVVSGGVQTYEYEFEGSRDKAILLNFGTSTTYELTQTTKLENRGWWWNDYVVIIPADTNQQTVALESISPKPKSIRLDRDGNILANYSVSPLKTVEVQAKSRIGVRSLNYNTDGARPVEDVPESLKEYLSTEGVFEGGQQYTGDDSYELLTKVYDDAVEDALEAIEVVKNLRASGLPARTVKGLLLHNGHQQLEEPITHAWAEAYVPGSGWMTVDPLIGQNYAQLGVADSYRIAQSVNAERYEQLYELDTEVTTLDEQLPEEAATPEITRMKYLIVPGVSLTKTNASMPAGIARDGLGYREDGSVKRLGSLAPLQNVGVWSLSLGFDSWIRDQAEVGQLDGEELEVLNESTTTVNFLPVIVLLTLSIVTIFIFTKIHRRRNQPIVMNAGDEDDGTPADELLRRRREDARKEDNRD